MADPAVVEEQHHLERDGQAVMRSMPTFIAGTAFAAVGLAVVLDELSGLSFGQTASLTGLVAGLAVLAAVAAQARPSATIISTGAPIPSSEVSDEPTTEVDDG